MNPHATLTVAGTIAGRRVETSRLVEQLADWLEGTDGAKLPIQLDADGATHEAPIVAVEMVKLASGQLALHVEVEVADEILLAPPTPPILTGADATEDERARTMPRLEEQLADARNVVQ